MDITTRLGFIAGVMIRFPLSTMLHSFPMGLRYDFMLRKFTIPVSRPTGASPSC